MSDDISALLSLPAVVGELSRDDLGRLAELIERAAAAMRARRREVEQLDPWRFGLILAMMAMETKDGRTVFETFQSAGFWQDMDFETWAKDLTEVSASTWQNWQRAAEVFLLSEEGSAFLARARMSRDDFIRLVPMDKALRAIRLVAEGAIEEHQAEALIDPTVTVAEMRLAVHADAETWRRHVEERRQQDAAWVNQADDPMVLRRGLALYLRWNGKEYLVCRFAVPTVEQVEQTQRAMAKAAERLWELRDNTEETKNETEGQGSGGQTDRPIRLDRERSGLHRARP